MYDQAAVTLLVQDDGQGFDPKAAWPGDRFGLRAISERARVLGATVDVDSLVGWGTRIRARFPYRRDDEQTGPRLRVLVAAARPLLRAGIVRLLSGHEPGIDVIGEAATAEQALEACRDLRPDVVLADLGLAAGDTRARRHGLAGDVTALLLSHCPDLSVVGLCEVGDSKLVASAMRAGAREKHAGAVLRKTGARNRTELAALASRARLRADAR